MSVADLLSRIMCAAATVVEAANSGILLPCKNSKKTLQKRWKNAVCSAGLLMQFDSLFRNGFPCVERPSR